MMVSLVSWTVSSTKIPSLPPISSWQAAHYLQPGSFNKNGIAARSSFLREK